MRFFVTFLLIFSSSFAMSQEPTKIQFKNFESLLMKIQPNEKLDFWTLLVSDGTTTRIVKSTQKAPTIQPSSLGLKEEDSDENFYYFVVSKKGKTTLIQNVEQLNSLIGSIDNPEEAALKLLQNNYMPDFEFKDLAANYIETNTNYQLELSKLISKECPYQKNHFSIIIDKKTNKITEEKDLGKYFEIYSTKCANNPRMQIIKKEPEPYIPPKKPVNRKKKR